MANLGAFNAGYEPEGYLKVSKVHAIYYVDVHRSNESLSGKHIGIGSNKYPDILLAPSEALKVLAWLTQEREALEQLAKEGKNDHE